MFKPHSFIVLLSAAAVMRAPNAVAAPNDSLPEPIPVATSAARVEAPSIAAHLQLKSEQVEKLNRLYDAHASNRDRREAKIAQKQDELDEAQSPASFDERRASRLGREIGETQRKMTDDFLATRANALKILSPVQRSQLESLSRDNRIRVRFDHYCELLLTPVDVDSSLENRARQPQPQPQQRTAQRDNRQNRRHRGTTRYDVYGGYAYGQPNYGVVGSYGDGPFGAHVGIGSGGPFFGVGIGGVLSGGR